MLVRLSTLGQVFSTRPRGQEVRAQIEALIDREPAESIVLDFADVELISYSFADELVGRLVAERAAGGTPIILANANDEVLEPIERSLERRSLIALHVDPNGRTRLLSAAPHLEDTFQSARARGQFRAPELAADLGISVPACNNRLQPLLRVGLLARSLSAPRTGGREFAYRVTWASGEHLSVGNAVLAGAH